MSEQTILSEQGVLVTTKRLVANGSTYAIRNVDSVRMAVLQVDRKTFDSITASTKKFESTYFRSMFWLMPIGGLVLGVGWGGWHWLWLPVCTIMAVASQTFIPALNKANLRNLSHPYICMVRLSGREVEVLRSDNEEFVRRVAHAIGDALVKSQG